MLFAVTLSHSLTILAEVLLERRIDNQFLGDRMTGKFPNKLIPIPRLVVVVV